MPRTIAYLGSICVPNAPASTTRSTVFIRILSINSLKPACRAALASWIARISFCRIVTVSVIRYLKVRPSASILSVRLAKLPSMTPSAVISPVRYISPKASIMPEPQIPVIPVSETASSKPSSSDQISDPITENRGSKVSGLIRSRSIAPGAARWPELICAPSKAGPVGDEAARSLSLLPSTISAFVPTSISNCTSLLSCGASARTTPAASAPT